MLTLCVVLSVHTANLCVVQSVRTVNLCVVLSVCTANLCVVLSVHTANLCVVLSVHTANLCVVQSVRIVNLCVVLSVHTANLCISALNAAVVDIKEHFNEIFEDDDNQSNSSSVADDNLDVDDNQLTNGDEGVESSDNEDDPARYKVLRQDGLDMTTPLSEDTPLLVTGRNIGEEVEKGEAVKKQLSGLPHVLQCIVHIPCWVWSHVVWPTEILAVRMFMLLLSN